MGNSHDSPCIATKEGRKSYVFVDEHHRHKRLKACTRLKLQCIPPTFAQDSDMAIAAAAAAATSSSSSSSSPPSSSSQSTDKTTQFSRPDVAAAAAAATPKVNLDNITLNTTISPPITSNPFIAPSNTSVGDLTDAFGDLKIDESGIAPYIRQQRKNDPSRSNTTTTTSFSSNATFTDNNPSFPSHHSHHIYDNDPSYYDYDLLPLPTDIDILSSTTAPDGTIFIPTHLMPSDSHAMRLFDIFFTHIHPYVPVLHRAAWYAAWHADKTRISPLLLEAVLACAARFDVHPDNRPHHHGVGIPLPTTTLGEAGKWLALANSRADFGVSLDTVETRPHWTPPNTDAWEAERSRQFTYFIQLAYTIRVSLERYHQIAKQPDWGADPYYASISSQLDKWVLNLPPDLQINIIPTDSTTSITTTTTAAAADLDLAPPPPSPPLPSHFIANMHCYLHLGVISLCRPLLLASKNFSAAGGQWRTHMARCYNAAKALCQLQEAIISTYGLNGMLYMQRGVNFSIYGVLACTMIHLVATTSPDPEFNTDSRMYFTRHMRILEQCSAAWPLPTLRNQVDSLRLAFSQDITKPFTLKANFPYGSPSEPYLPSPRLDEALIGSVTQQQQGQQQYHVTTAESADQGQVRLVFESQPITPPITSHTTISATADGSLELSEYLSNTATATTTMATTNPQTTMIGVSSADTTTTTTNSSNNAGWDPIRIIDQWDMAFPTGGGSSIASSESPSSSNQNTSTPEYSDLLTPQYMPQYVQQQQKHYHHHQHQHQHHQSKLTAMIGPGPTPNTLTAMTTGPPGVSLNHPPLGGNHNSALLVDPYSTD
ncbi:hypothetical protein KEM54_001138, partial [Ascosphaera aggregata]